jgi:hypothetical protein
VSIAYSILTQGEAAAVAGVVATASVSTTPNALVLVCVEGRWSSPPGGSNFLSLSSDHGTWDQSAEQVGFTDPTNRWVACFRHLGVGDSGVITITGPVTTISMSWMVIEFTGVDTSGDNGLGALNNVDPLDSTFGSSGSSQPAIAITDSGFNTGDWLFAYCQTEDGENVLVPGTGWTEIADFIGSIETGHAAQYIDTDAEGFDGSWTNMRTSSRSWSVFGAIIKIGSASAGGPLIAGGSLLKGALLRGGRIVTI